MTLATVARYDPGQRFDGGDHAIVIGAGIAGLCAARVLADGFSEVTVVDRDPLPSEPVSRRGVPQARHTHVLLGAGQATLEDLFPGFGEDLFSAGGVVYDASRDVKFYVDRDCLAEAPQRRSVSGASRALYEHVVRKRVADRGDVTLRPHCQYTKYLVDDTSTAIAGIAVRPDGGPVEELHADLVVDATGRTSRTPKWLAGHGYTPPPVDTVPVDVAYSTTPIERPTADRRGAVVIPSPRRPRGGTFLPVEDDRWLMTLWGMHGEDPPTDPDGFLDFTASLPVPDFRAILVEHPWRGNDIAHYPFPSNLRRRYETLGRFPEGLVVLGDAIASFNPIYGQGMSVAALQAVQLHHVLTTGQDDLAMRFFDRVTETVDVAWNLAVRSDYRFPQTRGPKPPGTDLLNRYLSRFFRKAHTDGRLRDVFFHVQMMEQHPTTLLHPSVVWHVLKPAV